MIEPMYQIEISIKMAEMYKPLKETKKRTIPLVIAKRYCKEELELVVEEISKRVIKAMTMLFEEDADDD